MSERTPEDFEPDERDPDDLAHELVEPDPDAPPSPVPDELREEPVDVPDDEV